MCIFVKREKKKSLLVKKEGGRQVFPSRRLDPHVQVLYDRLGSVATNQTIKCCIYIYIANSLYYVHLYLKKQSFLYTGPHLYTRSHAHSAFFISYRGPPQPSKT